MRRMSDRREQESPERKALVERVLRRDSYTCTARIIDTRCFGPVDVHEVVPRSRWPAGYLVDDNCRAVCRRCHAWIHAHPAEATRLGLLLPRGDR